MIYIAVISGGVLVFALAGWVGWACMAVGYGLGLVAGLREATERLRPDYPGDGRIAP